MHITLSMAAGPIVGAVIGYFTNSIAVKMLFRPLYEKRIGKFRVPFTPGIIPKGQSRLAKAVGEAVGKQLLTEDVLMDKMISDNIEMKLKDTVGDWIDKQAENDDSISEVLRQFTTLERIESRKNELVQVCSEKIEGYIDQIGIGKIVAQEVVAAANQYVQGTILAMMITPDALQPVGLMVEQKVDDYMKNDGMLMISAFLRMEADQLLNQKIAVYGTQISDMKEEVQNVVYEAYKSFVKSYMERFIRELDISKIVEDKINEMDVKELESLVMSVMKNELRAVVNLGAVIGFVLGLINTFI